MFHVQEASNTPAAAGQSSQGQGPAAAAAGDDGVTPYQKELLYNMRKELKNSESEMFKKHLCQLLRQLVEEEEAEETDDEETRQRKKGRRNVQPQPLTMANLVESLYKALILHERKRDKKKSKGNTGESISNKCLKFTDSDGFQYSHIKLGPTDNADCISPTDVVKVYCDYVENNDLIFTWTKDTYAKKVAELPKTHTVVKILRRSHISIPKKI